MEVTKHKADDVDAELPEAVAKWAYEQSFIDPDHSSIFPPSNEDLIQHYNAAMACREISDEG